MGVVYSRVFGCAVCQIVYCESDFLYAYQTREIREHDASWEALFVYFSPIKKKTIKKHVVANEHSRLNSF